MNIKTIIIGIFSILILTNIYAAQKTTMEGLALSVDLLNQTPEPARAGDIVEFRFNLQNKGNLSVNDLTATLNYSYPFSEIPGEETIRTINKIFAYQDNDNAQILIYKLFVDKDAPNGTYEISLRIKRSDQEITNIYKFNINVIGKEYAQIITINKSNIDFGVVDNLDFLITNTGNSQLKNIVFSWIDPTETLLPVNSDNTKYIKSLEVGESKTLSYNVMANSNSTPGLYKLNLSLNFENEDFQETTINTIAGIFIGGQTDFDITFSESDSGVISLSIANIGNNPAYSINLIIPEQENYSVTGSNSSILGNLDKGDYTIGSFNITSKRTMDFNTTTRPTQTQNTPAQNTPIQNKNNLLKVTVEYTDSLGQRNSITKEINIQQNTRTTIGTTTGAVSQFNRRTTKSTNWYIYIIIGVVVLSCAFYAYKKYQKNKLKRKA
jgi:hypothetical protein